MKFAPFVPSLAVGSKVALIQRNRAMVKNLAAEERHEANDRVTAAGASEEETVPNPKLSEVPCSNLNPNIQILIITIYKS